jgi:hypothetical protein
MRPYLLVRALWASFSPYYSVDSHVLIDKRRLAVGGSLLACLALTPAASASRLRQIASPVYAFSSDGIDHAAWEASEDGPIVVLDTRTGQQTTLTPPPGCRLADQGEGGSYLPTAAAGRLLIQCEPREQEELLDMRTGQAMPLPAGTDWYEFGTRYAVGNDAREHQVVIDLATGAVRRVGETEYVDLDRRGAPGLRSVCPALRNALRREAQLISLGAATYRNGILAGQLGEHGMIQLRRCDGRRTVLAGQHVDNEYANHVPRSFDLRGGLLSWDTGSDANTTNSEETPRRPLFRARLDILAPGSHRRRSWTLPRRKVPGGVGGPDAYGYSAHTSDTVFWLATRSLTQGEAGPSVASYSLYSARF